MSKNPDAIFLVNEKGGEEVKAQAEAMGINVEVVSTEKAELADVVVCVPKGWKTPFTDNEYGTCAFCGCEVQFRPHAPKSPPRMCMGCFVEGKADDIEMEKH